LRITVEIDDDEIRRLLAPLAQQAPTPPAQTMTRLLNVREVADRLGVSRNKVYELLYKGEIHSLAIGRTRRISPAALAEFISRPRENALGYTPPPPRAEPERSASYLRSARTTRPQVEQPKARRSKPSDVIDLSQKPLPPGSRDLNMTSEEFEGALASMVEKGWPVDVIDQIRADRKDGVHRVNLLTINDAAKYLGLSRYGIEKLVKAGKLRRFTIAPMYRDQKPETRIPAKDILALT
jgi:excisionase family DNA binding protein